MIFDELDLALELARTRGDTPTRFVVSQLTYEEMREAQYVFDDRLTYPTVAEVAFRDVLVHLDGTFDCDLYEHYWRLELKSNTPIEARHITVPDDTRPPIDWSQPIEWNDGTPAWVEPGYGVLDDRLGAGKDWYAVNSHNNPSIYPRGTYYPTLGQDDVGIVIDLNGDLPDPTPRCYIRNRAPPPQLTQDQLVAWVEKSHDQERMETNPMYGLF